MVTYPLPTESESQPKTHQSPAATPPTSTQRKGTSVVLDNISWSQYERLLAILGDRPATRIAYDQGLLEIMTPLPDHEYFSDALADAVKDIADELEMDCDCYGSATWRKELGQAGIEPDNFFTFKTSL